MADKAKNFSRKKGLRVEYLLRDYMRAQGYDAYRVPLSGASEGFKCDVIASKADSVVKFEMKARKTAFNAIYKMYFKYKMADGVWRFLSGPNSRCIAVGVDFEAVRQLGVVFEPTKLNRPGESRTIFKINNMYELLGEADCLVIKGNSKPMLFIKYWV